MKMDLHKTIVIFLAISMFMAAISIASAETAEKTAGADVVEEATSDTEAVVPFKPATMTGDFKSAVVIDAETGMVLVANNQNVKRQPASMTKMMTELIVLEHIVAGDLTMDEIVTVSAKSSNMGGSQVYLKHNEKFTVEELLQALAIHSANDAAVALAEHVAGSTDAFVDLMNMRSKDLGMTDTDFHSVHGLPAGYRQKPDLTTAYDLAVLGRELVKFPHALQWASTKTAPFRDGKFTLYNPNKLVGTYRGLDGIKTGYTGAAGFCVTASAIQMGKRLISVVMGCSSNEARANETTRLLTYGFNAYQQVEGITATGEPLAETVVVKGGKSKTATLTYKENLKVTVPRGHESHLVVSLEIPESIQAPLEAGAPVGRAIVTLDGQELGSVPLVLVETVAKGNWLDRLLH